MWESPIGCVVRLVLISSLYVLNILADALCHIATRQRRDRQREGGQQQCELNPFTVCNFIAGFLD